MRRRLLALACALAVLASAAPASAAARPYVHEWLAEGQVGGDLGGASRKDVVKDEMTLAMSRGAFVGHLRYIDELGIEAASGGVTGQSASIEVTLTGGPLEGGSVAAGTFTGEVQLVTRRLRALDAVSGMAADSSGVMTKYDVSGHWGATLAEGVANGELVFERATLVGKSMSGAEERAVEWFNRLSIEPDGGPQTFQVRVTGLAAGAAAAGSGANGAAAEGSATAVAARDGGSGSGATGTEAAVRLGFLDYVSRGVAGEPGVPAAPVPQALSQRARALKDAAPAGALPLPANAVAVDVDVTGTYLDAKNRAAGLLGPTGPSGEAGTKLAAAWRNVGAADIGGARDALTTADVVSAQGVPGAAELASDLRAAARAGTADARELRAWSAAVYAVGADKPVGSVLGATVGAHAAVAATPIPQSGPMAAAVLAAVQSRRAPREAVAVEAMRREEALDAEGTANGTSFPNRVLARAGATTEGGRASLGWDSTKGRVSLAPSLWLAYRRADDTLFWLPGPDGTVALTDGTLRGAGFTVARAYLVDAGAVGRILAVYDLR